MTILERKSERKKKALKLLVETGEYTIAFAMIEAERLNDEGKLLDNDYEELMEYLESLLTPVEDANIEENASYTEQDASVQPEEENLEET